MSLLDIREFVPPKKASMFGFCVDVFCSFFCFSRDRVSEKDFRSESRKVTRYGAKIARHCKVSA